MNTTKTASYVPKAIFAKRQHDMSPSEEQASRECISDLIKEHRVSNHGKIHIIEQSGAIQKNTPIDPAYQPESAVFVFRSEEGDEHYYNQSGYEVFED